MTASHFHGNPSVPAAVADLDLALVAEVLARNGCNVSDAAAELHVPPSDLRRPMWSKPNLLDEAFEVVEGRIDKAEKNIYEALHSDDPRMRVAASTFTLRNSVRAKRRGWITSAAAAVDLTIAAGPQREEVYFWRSGDAAADEAKVARLFAAALIEHQDAIAPEPATSTPTLPQWPGPYPPPPLVAHLYAPYAPPPRVAPARPRR